MAASARRLGDALRRRQVDDARLLVGVEVEVLVGAVGPRPVVDEGGEAARAGALGRLDQRDLGPEVGEQASAQGGALVGQVEDANAVEGQEGRIVGGRGASGDSTVRRGTRPAPAQATRDIATVPAPPRRGVG